MDESPAKNERLEALFSAALGLFARYGFRRTRVEDVAERLGMTKGNVYFYVRNKEELYHRTIEWALGSWKREIESSVKGEGKAGERFAAMARKAFSYLRDHDELRAILEADPDIYTLDPAADRFASINSEAKDLLRGILAEGMASGDFRADLDLEATADFLYSVYIAFLIKTYSLAEGQAAARLFEAGIELAIRGLSA